MKTMKFLKTGALAIFLGIVSVSCSKKETEPQPANNQAPDRATIIKKLKNLKFSFTEAGSGNYNYNSSNNTFTYVEPNSGTKYTEVRAGYEYNGVDVQVYGNISKGGGSFEVDGKNIELDYVICLSGEEKGFFGADGEAGQSILIGISGKFDATDEENSKIDYLVVAVVNEEKANGKYEVLWENLLSETNADKFAFFYVADLSKVASGEDFEDNSDAKIYFSVSGAMTFSNGNIQLNDIKMAEILLGSTDDEGGGELGKQISAAGELTCE